MKYLYYSLYQFYTKIFRIQNHYPPVINTTGVIAALELFIIFTVIDIAIFETTGERLIKYSPLVPTGIFIGLYWLNYQYFKDKEEAIIKDVDTYSLAQKILMYILTLSLVALLVWGYLFDGFYDFIFK